MIRNVTVVISVLLIGLFIGSSFQAVRAQTDSCQAAGAWDVQATPGSGGHWYAVRFNRCTGEAWVLAAAGDVNDDKWLLLRNEKK